MTTASCEVCGESFVRVHGRVRYCSDLCRIVAKFDILPNGCWEWTAYRARAGYGAVRVAGVAARAHRFVYSLACEEVPDDLDLDHLCRNRACVNPDHLEPVTRGENSLRGTGPTAVNALKTHCKRGHEFTPENTYHQPSRPRGRACIACIKAASSRRARLRTEARRAARKAAA